ncbi:inorganic diphosphatase [Streptomyces shenzhenensis]|uniref:inorganic diphosphatase n=1 Tax=Streptomyces shenzhenensis TaxID=943815 RepID=UPI003408C829
MPRIAVAVDATVASTIKREDDTAEPMMDAPPAHGEGGWPVGHGHVVDTLGDDGLPVEALVLMCEPAIPRGQVAAWPIAVLHLAAQDRTVDEVLCVAEAAPFTDLVDLADLPAWHAQPEAWAKALARFTPGSAYRIAGLGPAGEADELLDTAWHAFLQLTGCLE